MGKTITWETAKHMMDIAAYIYCQLSDEEPSVETVEEFARTMFLNYCESEDITEVEEPDEEEKKRMEWNKTVNYLCDKMDALLQEAQEMGACFTFEAISKHNEPIIIFGDDEYFAFGVEDWRGDE